MIFRHPIAPLLALGLALLAGADPAAADTARRLKIDLELRRDGAVQHGADQGRGRLVQQLTLIVVLHSDGTPMPNNPLDPEDGKRQLERAQRSQQRMQAAQAKYGSTPAAAPDWRRCRHAPSGSWPSAARTGECLMREASAISAAQVAGGDRATQDRLQAYGQAAAACERQPAKAARGLPGRRPATRRRRRRRA